ncbi:spore germination protein [Fictibacillus phosphorivorans]|uniref:spore germination protein n=1 Tax=Fictibacillus phosphorivorans TaxID=1221500 RepID=UPI003CEFCA7E
MTFFKKPKKLLEQKQTLIQEETQESSSTSQQTSVKKSEQDANVNQHQSIDDLLNDIDESFSSSEDLQTHLIEMPSDKSKVSLIFLDSIIDKQKVQDLILNPLFELDKDIDISTFEKVINVDFKKQTDFTKIQQLLLQSYTLIFTKDMSCYFSVFTPIKTERDISEPDNEAVIRGSHEGFIESMSTNIALIRKRLKSQKLVVKYLKVGKETHTNIAMLYMSDIANPEILHEVERRITSIEADSVMTPGNIEESIEDRTYSLFPQTLSTERPDRVAANLMEGRIALLYDSSPTVNLAPVNFFVFFQTPDDYNKRWMLGSFYRLIRLFSFFIAIGLPAFYIAIVSFHYEVIPSALILLMKSSLENIPYPPLFEALVMELTIELIREAAIRLPTRIGSTIAIVGGLVIGDAVVKAGLISNLMIIVVATTAIAAYTVPSNEMSLAVRLLRFPFMVAAATFGFLGIVFGLIIMFFHLCRLYSFGTPYFAPLAPFKKGDLKDTIIRLPFFKMNSRPGDIRPLKKDEDNHTRKWEKS